MSYAGPRPASYKKRRETLRSRSQIFMLYEITLFIWLLYPFITPIESFTIPNKPICSVIGNKKEKRSSNYQFTTTLCSTSSHQTSLYYKHILAILTLPETSRDRIANEAILHTCLKHAQEKVSIVLRCQDSNAIKKPKLNELRGYVGEIYSLVWDSVLGLDRSSDRTKNSEYKLLDVIVYPQSLPNAAPEKWLHNQEDLDCICSHDSITGWISSSTQSSRGIQYRDVEGSGCGGLQSHVEAVNIKRKERGLEKVRSMEVEEWPDICLDNFHCNSDVIFLEDEEEDCINNTVKATSTDSQNSVGGLIGGGYRIPSTSLYNSVAVGGTFDGMHYGHRKLLTLAVSSVVPVGGKLLIGITTDEMLQKKAYADFLPPLDERVKEVRKFVDALAPGMKNRIRIIPIKDMYGPPGAALDSSAYKGIINDFDALVLSHETLSNGKKLNEHRVKKLGLEPLKLLCTRRTEVHGMSSTVLRKIRKKQLGGIL